ncbi:MAG TPA: DNA methyltransferase [Vicinamibacterales bacterium]
MTERLYTILNRDAFEWLPLRPPESVEAVVTDPPYGIVEYSDDQLAKRKNGKGIWRLPQAYDGYKRTSMPRFTVLQDSDRARIQAFHQELAPLLGRVLVPGGHVFLASHNLFTHLVINAFVAAGFELRGQVARIVKTLRGGDRPKGAHVQYPEVCVSPRSCWEPWLIFRKPCDGRVRDNLERWGTGALKRPHRDVPFPDLIVSSTVRGLERTIANHPSVKPQAFMRQIVAATLPLERGTVLDPFMGSGATVAAATALGIRSVGLEINREYYALARRAIPKLSGLVIDDPYLNYVTKPLRFRKTSASG